MYWQSQRHRLTRLRGVYPNTRGGFDWCLTSRSRLRPPGRPMCWARPFPPPRGRCAILCCPEEHRAVCEQRLEKSSVCQSLEQQPDSRAPGAHGHPTSPKAPTPCRLSHPSNQDKLTSPALTQSAFLAILTEIAMGSIPDFVSELPRRAGLRVRRRECRATA